jgi:hypothetical protein
MLASSDICESNLEIFGTPTHRHTRDLSHVMLLSRRSKQMKSTTRTSLLFQAPHNSLRLEVCDALALAR